MASGAPGGPASGGRSAASASGARGSEDSDCGREVRESTVTFSASLAPVEQYARWIWADRPPITQLSNAVRQVRELLLQNSNWVNSEFAFFF